MEAMTLKSFIRQSSLAKLRQFSNCPEIQIEDLTSTPMMYAFWMSVILISGNDLRITLKVHFQTSDGLTFTPVASAADPRSVAKDFARELCNLTAGAIKIALQKNNIPTGASLPFVVRGFDQIFPMHGAMSHPDHDRWRLRGPRGTLHLTSEIEIFKDFTLADTDLEDSSAGDVEFL